MLVRWFFYRFSKKCTLIVISRIFPSKDPWDIVSEDRVLEHSFNHIFPGKHANLTCYHPNWFNNQEVHISKGITKSTYFLSYYPFSDKPMIVFDQYLWNISSKWSFPPCLWWHCCHPVVNWWISVCTHLLWNTLFSTLASMLERDIPAHTSRWHSSESAYCQPSASWAWGVRHIPSHMTSSFPP